MEKTCKTCGQIKEKHPYYLSNTLACGLFEKDDIMPKITIDKEGRKELGLEDDSQETKPYRVKSDNSRMVKSTIVRRLRLGGTKLLTLMINLLCWKRRERI
ncbi:MAG: hypothetical protein ACFFD1_00940 [Candidatus Thorarchaeota archaeon]